MANIKIEKEGAMAHLILNRPEKKNLLNRALLAEFTSALDDIAEQVAEDSIRVLVISGEGDIFCAGQDLSEDAATKDGDALRSWAERSINPIIRQLRGLPVPIVASIKGLAAGAGFYLALACDIVMAEAGARFVPAFVKLGLSPLGGASYFLPRYLGQARALGFCMTGTAIDAKQAEDWGLIWKAVPGAEFDSAIRSLTQELAEAPTFAIAQIKTSFNASFHNSLESQLQWESEMLARTGDSEDYREGRSAFLEKRPAKFWGR